MPCSTAFLPASSAAICAAYGVDLREPLKPIMPDDDHEIALPDVSVMVMIVLLKVAATCATPTTTFFFSFLRARPALFLSAMLLRHFLLAGDRFRRAFARARVGVRPLAVDRETLTVTQPAIRTEVHKALNIHRHVAAQIAFDEIVAVDGFTDLNDFVLCKIGNTAIGFNTDRLHDFL